MNTIEEALQALRKGGIIIVVDDEDRENEGDFILSADLATPETVNFLSREGCGLICAALDSSRAEILNLKIPQGNSSLHGTAFTDSVDYIHGTTTGISASDRCATFLALADQKTIPADLARPGHVFPLIAKNGGVLERRGHTEATVDLCRLAGLSAVGILCEILNPDGTMARLPQLENIAKKYNLPLISVEQLVLYRKTKEQIVVPLNTVCLPTPRGDFDLTMHSGLSHQAPLSLKRDKENLELEIPLVRVHSECLTGDLFSSLRCDCGPQLELAMDLIGKEPKGAIIYLRQEGRGIGLEAKLKAYSLQEQGYDTWEANVLQGLPADGRDYWEAAQILKSWGWTTIRLLTNNPAKVVSLEKYGIKVNEILPLIIAPVDQNRQYLETKKVRFGHIL